MSTVFITLYLINCAGFYFTQEKHFFTPTKLAADHKFHFNGNFEELNFKTTDDFTLNSLLFRVDNPKGLVFYLHGSGGSLASLAEGADVYIQLGYNVFMMDYRGFGKSGGDITSEQQLYEDNQMLYDELKKTYAEEDIIVVGYSLGAAMAAKLASTNNPKLLILKAPFYNFNEAISQNVKLLSKFFPLSILNKYGFNNNQFIQKCKMPVLIFHGTNDKINQYSSSLELKKLFKPEDDLILLEGEGHDSISNNLQFQKELKTLLGD
ncbi:alpha/beta fold hydrolase [Aquimarina sp. MMG016]|nr:alpha/beta fold hydrolase [Aquimarina sp. MMG016]